MATKLFFRHALATHCRASVAWTKKIGTGPYVSLALSTTAGSGVQSISRATVAGPTAGIEVGGGATYGSGTVAACYVSEPIDADVTISGTVTINIWAAENNMADNVAINCDIYKLPSNSDTVTNLVTSARTVEVAVTTRAVNNFTATPTSTAFNKGDRILAVIWGDDSTANMGSGSSFNIGINGGTGGADGDSWISFTETFGFLTTAPSGSTYYFRSDDPGGVSVADRDAASLSTSRGSTAKTFYATMDSPGANAWTPGNVLDRDDVRPYLVSLFNQTELLSTGGGSNMDDISSTAHRNAQGFQLPSGLSSYNIRKIFINLNLIGPDDDPRLNIHSDSSGNPGTSLVADQGVGFGPNNTFGFDDTLSASTQYWMVLRNASGASFTLTPTGSTTDVYANGNYSRSTNSGGSWTPNTSWDQNFTIHLGYPIYFYTPELAGSQTLSGLVKFNARLLASSNSVFSAWAELAVVSSDGSSPTVWAYSGLNDNALGDLTTSDTAYTFWFCGDDLAISANQRIRIRVMCSPIQSSGTISSGSRYIGLGVDGPSASAAGDSWLQFSQTINEAGGAGPTEDPMPYVGSGYYPTQG